MKTAEQTLKDLEATIAEAQAKAAELRKIIAKPEELGLWAPKHGERYWYIRGEGLIQGYLAANDLVDGRLWAHGNCFETEPIAYKASTLQRKYNFYLQACFQADPDAGEWSDTRCISVYKSVGFWVWCHRNGLCNDICVHTGTQAKEACRLLNEWQAKEDAK
jgi:hypothetical protein